MVEHTPFAARSSDKRTNKTPKKPGVELSAACDILCIKFRTLGFNVCFRARRIQLNQLIYLDINQYIELGTIVVNSRS
ncbi:hypothetical protein [Pseudomonas fluorescens]|uniref:hypothetical protein n=1 Tax=Pseudomonas fluorescens TaxID=294 RepID=UPI0012402F9E|nr:hypothetical protein [Pseudomonas fluorescens]